MEARQGAALADAEQLFGISVTSYPELVMMNDKMG